MGLFDSVRGLFEGDDEPAETESLSATPGERVSPGGREPTPTDFRNKAADAIQEWEVDLDYTYESLPRLDEFADRQGALLDVMADEQDDDERIADIHTGFTIRAGSYFGEVLVRELGGKWVQTDDGWQVAVPEGPEDDDPATVDVFEVAAHSFAKQPVFVEMAEQCGLEPDTDEADEPAAPEPEPQVGAEMEPVAAEFADFWSTYRLDFSLAALARLDDLVTTEWDRGRFADATIGGSDMDSEMLTKLVKQLGAYYGETLVRRLDGEWAYSGDELVVEVGGANATTVTVPVFDIAADCLTGDATIADHVVTVGTDAARDVPHPRRLDEQPTHGFPDPATADGATGEPADQQATEGATGSRSPAGSRTDQPSGTAPDDQPTETTADDQSAETDADERPADSAPADEEPDFVTRNQPPEPAWADQPADSTSDDQPTGTSPDDRPADAPSTDQPAGTAADGQHGETVTDEDVADVQAELAAQADAQTDDGPRGVESLRDDGMAFAASWPGYDLDFSVESLRRLDRLVAAEYDVTGSTDEQFLRAQAREAGGYFAEIIVRTMGGTWQEDGSLRIEGRNATSRIDPVETARDCFRGEASFTETYGDIQSRLSLSVQDGDRDGQQ
jgi:hypothetical protein